MNGASSCALFNLIQLKVLYCTHYSKTRLAKIYQNTDETCDRCNLAKSDLALHVLVMPNNVGIFNLYIQDLNDVFVLNMQPGPTVAIFGVHGDATKMTNSRDGAPIANLIARRRILGNHQDRLKYLHVFRI